ncbi:MAG: carboxypeptidase-like regulatory domain-containing protein [Myxococcota bacterium]
MTFSRTLTAAALVCALSIGWASAARADAVVEVQVRSPDGDPAEGVVTLQAKDGSRRYRCTTDQGRCRIEGVPGGRYEVRLKPHDGEAPPARQVMIPPSGKVKLIVSTKG